ncbi:hypothetical protein KRX19_07120 [Cardiobacteriaceae bacterium TAE3-ERU3]|nr:hypothetical protein [Cardiobacteriaceae bacterium TAE3-ERU3]
MAKLFFTIFLLFIATTTWAEDPATTLYLLGYDIPTEQRQQVVAQDVAAIKTDIAERSKAPLWRIIQGKEAPPYPQPSRDTYPNIDLRPLTLCRKVNDCPQDIAQNPQSFHDSLKTLAPVLRDIDDLQHSPSAALHTPFQGELATFHSPIPAYQYLIQPLVTRNAIMLQDDLEQGTIQACISINFGKNLIRSQSNLVQSIIGATLIDYNLDLLAHYPQRNLPEQCQSALQPLDSTTISLCPLMQYETNLNTNIIHTLPNIPFLLSHNHTIALMDEQYAQYCSNIWQQNISLDHIATAVITDHTPRKQCLLNTIGCILNDIEKPDYSAYQNRLQDSNAYLRLWQAAHDPDCQQDPTAYIAKIAPTWAEQRNLHLDDNRLTINTYNRQRRKHISVACQP